MWYHAHIDKRRIEVSKKETPSYWRPLVKLRKDETFRRPEIVAETMKHYGIDADAANAMLDKEESRVELYVNDIYQVAVGKCGPDDTMLHINIRRRDGRADLRDWRHFQQIKNEIAGPEREAFEVYPAESRKTDTSNKFHLWVLPFGVSMQVGWQTRDVQYETNDDVPGLRQRAL